MSDVFISYSRTDIAFARLIEKSLVSTGLDTWIDWKRIPIGQKWWEEIREAIEGANVFIFIISKNSLGSSVCKDEINHAIRNNKRIIPVIVDELEIQEIKDFLPELHQYNWVAFIKDKLFITQNNTNSEIEDSDDKQIALPKLPQFEQAIKELYTTIHTDWEWVKFHTKLQLDALEWKNHDQDKGYLIRGTALQESETQLLYATSKDPQPTPLQIDFFTASRLDENLREQARLQLEQRSRKRMRTVIWVISIGLVLVSLLGFLVLNQRNKAIEIGENSKSNELVFRAKDYLTQGNYDLSNILAMEALRYSDQAQNYHSNEAVSFAYDTYQRSVALTTIYRSDSIVPVTKNGSAIIISKGGHFPRIITPRNEVIVTLPIIVTNTKGEEFFVIFDESENHALTYGGDNTLEIWDINDLINYYPSFPEDASRIVETENIYAKQIAEIENQDFNIIFGKISANGERILTLDENNVLKVWTFDGVLLSSQRNHEQPIIAADISPKGEFVVSSSADGKVILWDTTTGREIANIKGYSESVPFILINSKGDRIITAGTNNIMRLWTNQGEEIPLDIKISYNQEFSAFFSPNNNYFISYDPIDNRLLLWNLSGSNIAVLDQPENSFNHFVSFNKTGTEFLSSGKDGIARLWDSQGNELQIFLGHKEVINQIIFSENEQEILTTSNDHTIKIWNIDGSLQTTIEGLVGETMAAYFHPDGITTINSENVVQLWNPEKKMFDEFESDQLFSSIAISPDWSRIVATSKDSEDIFVWNQEGTVIDGFKSSECWGWSPRELITESLSPDGNIIGTCSSNFDPILWNVTDNTSVVLENDDNKFTYSINFSQDSDYVIRTGDKIIQVFKSSGEEIATIPDNDMVLSASFNKNASEFVTCNFSGELRVFSLEGEELWTGECGVFGGVAEYSPDGRFILVFGNNGGFGYYEADGDWVNLDYKNLDFDRYSVNLASSSPSGDLLLTTHPNGFIILRTVHGDIRKVLDDHKQRINSISFSNKNGDFFVSTSEDGTLKLWDKNGTLLASFNDPSGNPISAYVNDQGTQIISLGSDGIIRKWKIDSHELIISDMLERVNYQLNYEECMRFFGHACD